MRGRKLMLQRSPAAAASCSYTAHKHARTHASKNTTCGENNKYMKPEHDVSGVKPPSLSS